MPSALAGLAVLFVVSSASANEKEAVSFIRNLADQAFQVLSDNSTTLDVREMRLRQLLQSGFAMDTIGRYVAGRYWKKMSEDQQGEYQKLFSEWTLRSYSSRLGGYKDQTLEIINAVDSGKKDINVRTKINQPSTGRPINCDWIVRRNKGEYKIVDIRVEGISMLITQKKEFGALLKRQGVEGLIEMLRMRNSKFPAMSG